MCIYNSVSCSVVSNSLQPLRPQPARLLCPWISLGKSIGVGSHFLLQGIFLTQGSNQGLLHCSQILYRLSHQESPHIYSMYICVCIYICVCVCMCVYIYIYIYICICVCVCIIRNLLQEWRPRLWPQSGRLSKYLDINYPGRHTCRQSKRFCWGKPRWRAGG